MGDAISECIHGSVRHQVTALRRHGQLIRLTCRQSDVNPQPYSTLGHLASSYIMLHHFTTPIKGPIQRVLDSSNLHGINSQTFSSQRLVNVRREKLAPTHFERALGARDLSYERGTVGSEAAGNESNHAKLGFSG